MKGKSVLSLLMAAALFWVPLRAAASTGNTAPADTADPFVLYEQGSYGEAAALFLKTAEQSRRKGRRAELYYNAARSCQEEFRQNGEAGSLKKAVELYYRCLELDPEMEEAAHNLELARLEEERLAEQSSENPSEGNSGGENQQSDQQSDGKEGDTPGSLSREQKELADRSDRDSPSHRQDQENLKDRTEQQRDQAGDSGEKDALEEALEQQERALSEMEKGHPDAARDAQEKAAEALEKAASLSQDGDPQAGEDTAGEPGGSEPEPESPSDRLLRESLNAEQARQTGSQVPSDDNIPLVERNW